jgi:hypothetical protein
LPLIAVVVIGVLLLTSLTLVTVGPSLSEPTLSGGSVAPDVTVTRDPLLWPFAKNSIWNLPIGANANYVWANIRHATQMAYFTDADILVLKPNAPPMAVYANYDDWGGGTRCDVAGPALFTLPIPADFVIPGSHQGSPDGDTPNAATAILSADGHTLIQTQPFARCAGRSPTSHYVFGVEDLYGTGETGSHGGSGLSALGGTVRLGELVPGGAIRHSLKLNIDSANFFPGFRGFRWPAWKSDAGGAGYWGSIPQVRMGTLLAVKPDFSVATLESEPGRIVAKAFQDYGAYIVDTSGWSINNFVTERSPDGSVQDEFQRSWGYSLNTGVGANGWARDLDKIFTNLWAVDNWDYPTWQTVSLSNGALGVGLGVPRVPWAPNFGAPIPDTVPPSSTTSIAGTVGTNGWYTSAVDVMVKSVDLISGVTSIMGRVDGGAWQPYARAIHVSGDGSHTIDYYATDAAGNTEMTHSTTVPIDSTQPTSAAAINGTLLSNGTYRAPVTITMTGTDATSGLRSILYRIDGGAWWTYTVPFRVGGSGPHTLEYQATDKAGNKEGSHLLSIPLESTGPIGEPHPLPVSALVTSGTPGRNGWYVSAVYLTFSGSSAVGSPTSVGYRLDGDPWTFFTGPVRVTDGRHTLDYQAIDADGYQEPTRSMGLNVDATPPSITQTSPAGGTISPDGIVAWSGSDPASGILTYEVSVDGGAYQSVGTDTSFTQAWSAGFHTVIVRATNEAGVQRTEAISFRVEGGGSSNSPGGLPLYQSMNGSFYRSVGFVVAILSLLLFYGLREENRKRVRRVPKAKRSASKNPAVPAAKTEEPATSPSAFSAAGLLKHQVVEERIQRGDGDSEWAGK